jgi:hypothetical protein
MITRTNAIRLGLYAVGIGLLVLGFYFSIFSELKLVTINGITIPELVYPYRIEGYILFFVGTFFEIFGLYYSNFKNFFRKKRPLENKTTAQMT